MTYRHIDYLMTTPELVARDSFLARLPQIDSALIMGRIAKSVQIHAQEYLQSDELNLCEREFEGKEAFFATG